MTLVAGAGFLSAGCYALQPAAGATPVPGTNVALDINDAGRVALGGSMGPSINRVNGKLMSKDGEDYVLAVSGVDLLLGGYQSWAGETVRINSTHVSTLYLRRFSPGRTIVLGAVAAGVAAVVVNKTLPRSAAPPDTTPIDTGVTRRGRLPAIGRRGLPPFLRSINPPRSY
jgi:hypothetical protein